MTTTSTMSIQQLLAKHKPAHDNLLIILHDLQDSHPQQYLTEEALESTAKYLNLTRSAVYGVATYYSMFSLRPRGKHIIRVCVSTVCELKKSNAVIGDLEDVLGIKKGETTACGTFTLEASECLGQCHEAPSMMINREVYNHVNRQKIKNIIESLRA